MRLARDNRGGAFLWGINEKKNKLGFLSLGPRAITHFSKHAAYPGLSNSTCFAPTGSVPYCITIRENAPVKQKIIFSELWHLHKCREERAVNLLAWRAVWIWQNWFDPRKVVWPAGSCPIPGNSIEVCFKAIPYDHESSIISRSLS
jgi:hypothetical protein